MVTHSIFFQSSLVLECVIIFFLRFTRNTKQYQLLEFNNSAKYISGKKGKQVYVFDYCK